MTNNEIAHLLRSVAASYEIKNEAKNRFRIIAYQRAADAIEHLSSEAKDLWDDEELEEVGGIGKSIASHLDEIFRKGKSKHFTKVMSGIKPATFELMKVPGIGPKTANKLTNELNITSADKASVQLERYGKAGKIANLPGMGEDSEKSILESLEELKGRKDRLLLSYASNLAYEVIEWLEKESYVKRADALGSIRRKASTVGDIDIAVASNKPEKAIEHFTKYPKAARVLEKGKRTASIIIPGNKQIDLMVEKPEAYGSLLQHFTGSKHHNIALREYGLKKNLSISDYGIYVKRKGKKTLKKFSTEEAFYKFLKMGWIPPELRESQGEIEAALKGNLPKLVKLKDIKADLQVHSDFDIETSHDLGESSMKDLVKKASDLGYEYIAFTEHNPSQRGHQEKDFFDIIKRKKQIVEQLNDSLVKEREIRVKRVFNSLEIDILPSGKIPVHDRAMELLDFALISIHSSFRQSRKKMTQRILKALEHPKVKIFAHPTGRKLNHREGVEIEWDDLFEFCVKKGKWLEINADPMRLDLPDMKVKDAIEAGVKLTLGTDAHHVDGMDNMRWGVSVARRGWAESKDIVNARNLREFKKLLEH